MGEVIGLQPCHPSPGQARMFDALSISQSNTKTALPVEHYLLLSSIYGYRAQRGTSAIYFDDMRLRVEESGRSKMGPINHQPFGP